MMPYTLVSIRECQLLTCHMIIRLNSCNGLASDITELHAPYEKIVNGVIPRNIIEFSIGNKL